MSAKIIADSVAPSGVRLATFEFRIPKCLLAEFNTHRMVSKNAASSRAIPVKRVFEQVLNDPYIPHFGKNKSGMQSAVELTAAEKDAATREWLRQRDHAVKVVRRIATDEWWWTPNYGFILPLEKGGNIPVGWPLNVHKQTANRLLEPFMYADVVATATDWQNVWHLRNHHMAHPDIQTPIRAGHELYKASKPRSLKAGEPHLPYLQERDSLDPVEAQVRYSVARCARVSMETQDGAVDIRKDLQLYDRLENPDPNDPDSPIHASPFEHVAFALGAEVYVAGHGLVPGWKVRSGNFSGWLQHRKQNTREVKGEPLWDWQTGKMTDQCRPRETQLLVPAGLYVRSRE